MAATDASVEQILAGLDAEKQRQIKRILYGEPVEPIAIPEPAAKAAADGNFELVGWKMNYPPLQTRPPRIVRFGVVQNSIVLPTTAPIVDQRAAIFAKVEKLIDAAAQCGVNILCLQEAWTSPFFMCTREKLPWCEFAEPAHHGPSFDFISRLARKYNMVIVSPILERDEEHGGTIWNTAVVVDNNGKYMGKHRKNHIPRVGDFNESTYYMEGNTGHPVFATAFGKIAINICYGRHHPLNWMAFGLNGAEIVFNPCATVGGLSEPMWGIEARNAAIANTYFTGSCNRVGTEVFQNAFTSGDGKPSHNDFGHFYGSSYISNPSGSRTPGLSRDKDGVIFEEVDLNTCQQVKDKWNFQMTGRHDMYAQFLAHYVRDDFHPQVIHGNNMQQFA